MILSRPARRPVAGGEVTVAQIHQMLRPGGLLAVTELESFPRFLTDPAGAALEDRIHTAMARGRDEAGMHMHENWPARFAEAGFAVESERRLVIALQPPPDSMPWPRPCPPATT